MRILKLEKLLKKNFCLLTKSGSTALYLLIKSLNIKGKSIIIPGNICYDVILVILFTGNKPLPIDIDKNQCLSFASLKRIKTKNNIGAIIYPYMYGNYGDVYKIKGFAKKNKIYFIEDIAPSLGIKVPNKKNTYISDYSFCSFGQGKIIDMNLGGSLNINSKIVYERARNHYSKLKVFSKKVKKKYDSLNNIYKKIVDKKISKKQFKLSNLKKYKDCFASKYNFKNFFLSTLNNKIKNINITNKERNKKAIKFQKIIKNKNINLLKHNKGAVYWRQNALVDKDRNKLLKYLTANKVYARKFFPSLDTIFPFIQNQNLKLVKNFELKILNFWVGKQTSLKNIEEINKHINNFFFMRESH